MVNGQKRASPPLRFSFRLPPRFSVVKPGWVNYELPMMNVQLSATVFAIHNFIIRNLLFIVHVYYL